MSKIRNVKITDFRIYQGEEDFSFETKEKEIANLVTVFGPNGYGKSSFFDAIQWSLTGEIERFSNNGNGEKAARSDGDYILTNRESAKKNNLGKVEIFGESKKILERKVKDKKARNIERRDDYKTGVLSKSSFIKKDLTINQAKVLSQDQIDAFIRHDSAEHKYDVVISFWDEGKKATEYLSSIRDKYIYTDNILSKCTKDLNDKEKEITALATLPQNTEQINLLIKKLHDSSDIDFKEEKFEDNIAEETYNTVVGSVIAHQEVVKNRIEKLQLKRTKLDEINNSLEKYLKDKIDHEKNENDIKEYRIVGGFYTEIDEIEKYIIKSTSELKITLDKIKDYKTLLDNKEAYQKLYQDLKTLKKAYSKLSDDKIKLINILKDVTEIISKSKMTEDEYRNDLKNIKEELSVIDVKYKSYTLISSDIKTISEDIVKPKKDLTEIDTEIKILQSKIDMCNEIETKFTSDLLGEIGNSDLIKLVEDRLSLLIQKNTLAKSLETKEQLYKKSGDLNENLNRIIKWGQEYINETKVSSCPLCNSKFSSFDTLLSEIEKDKGDALSQTQQEKDIEKVKKDIKNSEEKKIEIETSIIKIVDTIKEDFNKKLSDAKEKRYSLNEIIESFVNRDKINKGKLTDIESFFKSKLGDDSDINESSIKTYKDLQDSVHSKKEKLLTDVTKDIADKTTTIVKLQGNLTEFNAKIDLNKTNDDRISLSEVYINIQLLLTKYSSENLYDEKVDLSTLIEIDKIGNDKILQEVEEKKNKKDAIEINLRSNKYFIENTELKSKIESLANEIVELKKANCQFEEDFQKNTNSSTYKIEELQKKKELNEQLITSNKEVEVHLIDLDIKLKSFLKNIKLKKLKGDVDDLVVEKRKLDNTLEKLKLAKKECEEFIKNGINVQFNKKTINSIYQRISPHPYYREIDFNVDFNEKGKSILKITANNKEGDEAVDPLLYMSSGQINVLSLSVFLAKALNEKVGLETIFMDDPIQNLSDINVLSFIDLLRTLTTAPHNKQIVISTHDENFFKLLRYKMPEEYYSSKYLELESFGKLK